MLAREPMNIYTQKYKWLKGATGDCTCLRILGGNTNQHVLLTTNARYSTDEQKDESCDQHMASACYVYGPMMDLACCSGIVQNKQQFMETWNIYLGYCHNNTKKEKGIVASKMILVGVLSHIMSKSYGYVVQDALTVEIFVVTKLVAVIQQRLYVEQLGKQIKIPQRNARTKKSQRHPTLKKPRKQFAVKKPRSSIPKPPKIIKKLLKSKPKIASSQSTSSIKLPLQFNKLQLAKPQANSNSMQSKRTQSSLNLRRGSRSSSGRVQGFYKNK